MDRHPRAAGGEEKTLKEEMLKGIGFLLGKDKNVLEINSGDDCTMCQVH